MTQEEKAATAAREVLEKIEFLIKKYSLERRATTQPYLLEVVRRKIADYEYDPAEALVRETLLEHVGSTPVIATALYPYIENPGVDLGKALTMLAIHDIGELIIGDEMTFKKKADAKETEQNAALSLLHPSYHSLYKDAEAKADPTAQFAKAVDKIAPDILDYLAPAAITIRRYNHFLGIGKEEIIPLLIQHKRPHMLWNPFMTELHIHLINRFSEKLA